jgi:4-amino-4-deoxy-L-arabinose transferase-like glycosyltransferase
LINQPPLGFYIQALFSKIFGLSIDNGVFLVTLFGLGCIFLVYEIGKNVYNRTTGFFAAVLFAFTPWHLILSRSFLIDAQSLFFSLLFLLLGIIAVRKDSTKLFVFAGVVFEAAFSTKLYAVFVIIPFLILYFGNRPKDVKKVLIQLGALVAPVILFSFLWYQIISGLGMISIIQHYDLSTYNETNIVPSNLFVYNFLINYGLGWFFIDSLVLSLLVCLMRRRFFYKFFVFDLVCLTVIICVISINTFLGAYLNLYAPYLNAIKYDYQALPFFSFLAASLTTKSTSLFSIHKTGKLTKVSYFLVAVAGIILIMLSILYNMLYIHLFSTWNYLIFRVEPHVNLGYAVNSTPINEYSLLMGMQYLGFLIVLSGILWVSRHKIVELLSSKTK